MFVKAVNGNFVPGEHVSGDADFYELTTEVDIRVEADGDSDSQAALDTLVNVISMRGQPVIAGKPYVDGSDYIFKFSIEHSGSWADASTLVDAIVANAPGLGFTTGNTSVVISSLI